MLQPKIRRRMGFTLIELLIVMAIIVILVSLLLAGVFYAFVRANRAGASSDISQMAQGLQAFKGKYGVYPPSRIRLCGDYDQYAKKPTPAANGGTQLDQDSIQFINRMWPNIGTSVWSVSGGGTGINWAGSGTLVDEILEGDQCLVFFLGGIPNPVSPATSPQTWNDSWGFSVNPKDPGMAAQIANQNKAVGKVGPFFAFPANRLYMRSGQGSNFPSFKDYFGLQPYIFFSAYNRKNGYGPSYAVPILGVSPYYLSNGQYHNPDTFQIICAGADGRFGAGGQWTPATAETVYGPGNAGVDDMTSFYDALMGTSR